MKIVSQPWSSFSHNCRCAAGYSVKIVHGQAGLFHFLWHHTRCKIQFYIFIWELRLRMIYNRTGISRNYFFLIQEFCHLQVLSRRGFAVRSWICGCGWICETVRPSRIWLYGDWYGDFYSMCSNYWTLLEICTDEWTTSYRVVWIWWELQCGFWK